jgi:hypothetical protein
MEDTSNQFAVLLGRATTDVLMYTRINQCSVDLKKCIVGCFNKNKEKVSKTIIEYFFGRFLREPVFESKKWGNLATSGR